MESHPWEIRILPYPSRRRRALARVLPAAAMTLLTAAFLLHAALVCLQTGL